MELVRLGEVRAAAVAKKAAQILKKGGVVLYPTDTLYGLAVDATNPRALTRLRELKTRDQKKPISVIVSSLDAIEQYAFVSDTARQLALQFLPGALTLVLPARPGVLADIQLAGAVGFRIPDDPFCLTLAQMFGRPFTATSANRSGRENPGSVQEVLNQLGPDAHMIDLIVDDGPRNPARMSTVARVIGDNVHILREGVIERGEVCG